MRLIALALTLPIVVAPLAFAQAQPTTAPAAGGKLPYIEIRRQVRVDCQSLGVDAPLEFFCVRSGTSEHESILRSPVKASHLHLALLMLGLKPGQAAHFSEAQQKWVPPSGPHLRITLEYEKDGKVISSPANRWMRDMRTKKEMPPTDWIFVGSRVMEDGNYAADVTGYLVSVVNFDLTVIDIPDLASNANETLEWERNPEIAAPAGTRVTMVIEPVGDSAAPTTGTTRPPNGAP